MSEEDNSLEVFRRRCLKAVLMNDEHQVEQLCQCLVDIKGPNSLISLLMDTQHFPPLGQGYDPALLRALKDLMDTPLPPSPNHITHPASILESYSRAYRGLIIHLAANLGLTGIVCKLIYVAKRYQLDCTKQLTVTDVNYNTALCLAVRNYHTETIQAILDLLQEYPSSSTEFILRHCAAKTSRRPPYCAGSHLWLSITYLEMQSKKMGYNISSSISVLFLILCREFGVMKDFLGNYGISYYSSILDLCPFHYAAFLYSQRAMTEFEVMVLRSIYPFKCTFTCGYSDWDSIYALKIGNNMIFNGTPAHFAISSYQLSELALHKKFPDIQQASDSINRKRDENHPPMQGIQQGKDLPGLQGNEDEYQPPMKKRKVNGGHPPTQGTEEDEDEASWQAGEAGDNNPIFEMLRFLHEDFGINLLQVNWEGKTPLECLPPDADPALVNRLIDYLHYEHRTDA